MLRIGGKVDRTKWSIPHYNIQNEYGEDIGHSDPSLSQWVFLCQNDYYMKLPVNSMNECHLLMLSSWAFVDVD